MRVALWILVVLVAVGVTLNAGELHREATQRQAAALAAQAYLQSMAESEVAAKKAEALAKWKEDTQNQTMSLARSLHRMCAHGDTDACVYTKAQYAACNDLHYWLGRTSLPN